MIFMKVMIQIIKDFGNYYTYHTTFKVKTFLMWSLIAYTKCLFGYGTKKEVPEEL